MEMDKMFLVRAIGVAVASIGAYIIADGVGSILVQPTQPFWWFQFIRILRSCCGGALIGFGIWLISGRLALRCGREATSCPIIHNTNLLETAMFKYCFSLFSIWSVQFGN